MKYLILVMLAMACTPEVQSPPKCHFGDVATVLNSQFYAGCIGRVVGRYVAEYHYLLFEDKPTETITGYELDMIKCPKISLPVEIHTRKFYPSDLNCAPSLAPT